MPEITTTREISLVISSVDVSITKPCCGKISSYDKSWEYCPGCGELIKSVVIDSEIPTEVPKGGIDDIAFPDIGPMIGK